VEGAPGEVRWVEPAQLREWQSQGRSFILIDTLPKEIFDKRSIPGAYCACVYEVTFPQQIEAIVQDKEKEIILYGSSDASRDAATAGEKLLRLGYRKVFVLRGGVAAWTQGGYALKGADVVPPERAVSEQFSVGNGTYQIDLEKSVISWTGRNANRKHVGTLKLSNGQVRVHDNGMEGNFEIDMASIKNMDLEGDPLQPVLISHLMSDDFFFVKLFPRASFSMHSAKPMKSPTLGLPNFMVEGDFELRGVRAHLTFPVTLGRLADSSFSAEAHFDIDRTRWNVLYGSSRFFEHLGTHLVYDLISIEVRLEAREI
jgi:polyisoprenoid-binding protein YceI